MDAIAAFNKFFHVENCFLKYDDVIVTSPLLFRFGKWIFRDFERGYPHEQ